MTSLICGMAITYVMAMIKHANYSNFTLNQIMNLLRVGGKIKIPADSEYKSTFRRFSEIPNAEL